MTGPTSGREQSCDHRWATVCRDDFVGLACERCGSEPGRVQAPRCELCCVHGVPWERSYCPWCQDEQEDYYDAHPDDTDQQWLCPHGIGVEPGQDSTWPPRDVSAPASTPSPTEEAGR